MFEAILFDTDGVLRYSADSANVGYKAGFNGVGLNYSFNAVEAWVLRGIPVFNSRNELFKALYALEESGKSSELHAMLKDEGIEGKILALEKKFAFPEEKLKAAQRIHEAEFAKLDNPVYPGVKETLELLRKKVKLGIVSDARGDVIKDWAKRHELVFDVIIGNEDVKKMKPEPEGILKALEILKVKPKNACYVGDIPNDVKVARNAGVTSIAITTGMASKKLLVKEKPDFLIDDLKELVKNVEKN